LFYRLKSELAFLFPLHVMMAIEGGLFLRGRGAAGLGPAKGWIFGGLHVLLFHSSLAHRKSGKRDLEQLGGHPLMVARPETQSLQNSSAGCVMSVWLISLIRLFPHIDLCIPSYSNLSTCLGCCCLRLMHCKLHSIFPILTATNIWISQLHCKTKKPNWS